MQILRRTPWRMATYFPPRRVIEHSNLPQLYPVATWRPEVPAGTSADWVQVTYSLATCGTEIPWTVAVSSCRKTERWYPVRRRRGSFGTPAPRASGCVA